MEIQFALQPEGLQPQINRLWELSGEKIRLLEKNYDSSRGAPVFTVRGEYTGRGWTDWTRGFRYGSALLQFEATGEKEFLEIGRTGTLSHMEPRVTHMGVHDHGFNIISTYGNLLRLMAEKKIPFNQWEKRYYELALKVSGAIQAARWTEIQDGGFIYSFNGPHSLFVDTIRSCRSLGVGYCLGHYLLTENDVRINLVHRMLQHLHTTARYSIYYGEGRDSYDIRGRTAHEVIFNIRNGIVRCPNSQQGYSGFSTWTRGLAWAMCGFAEQLEFIQTVPEEELHLFGGRKEIEDRFLQAAMATCDFYIANTPVDGIPYWDTGAPNLHRMGDYLNKPADPFNGFEPVDSSAAAIAAQGLFRLGYYLQKKKEESAQTVTQEIKQTNREITATGPGSEEKRAEPEEREPEGDLRGKRYWQAGLTVVSHLFTEPYLNDNPAHQGLILHSLYHRPNGWDYVPPGSHIPHGESSMWGDYHAREVALYLQRIIQDKPYYTFFNCVR